MRKGVTFLTSLSRMRNGEKAQPPLRGKSQALFIIWNTRYETGIPILDEQYRGLVSLINSFFFHQGDASGDIYRVLVPTIEMFKAYAKINFVTIERLMRDSGYAKLDEYILLHDTIMTGIEIMDRKCRRKRDPEGVLQYLKEYWLQTMQNHKEDYLLFLRSHYRRSDRCAQGLSLNTPFSQ